MRVIHSMFERLQRWARSIRRDVLAIYLASRDPRVPRHAKWLAVAVAGYALSPIDLIPDFIPVIGYLDDLVIVPLGILLVVRMISPDVMAEHRACASLAATKPVSKIGAALIIVIWLLLAIVAGWLAVRFFLRH
jgi:uncharacterized membrane protein YkvA (DUF1232 family)